MTTKQVKTAELTGAASAGEAMSHITQRERFEAWNGKYGLSRTNAPGDDLDGYQCSHTNMAWKAWQAALAQPEPVNKQLQQALEELLECPYDFDAATISKGGLEETMRINPSQVVVNMSVAYMRLRKARAALAAAKGGAA